MSDKISMPSGTGGLLRYDEEYPSKIMLKPLHVVAFVIVIIAIWTGLKIFFK
jgi:preprotein translocase subunit Sec61beta